MKYIVIPVFAAMLAVVGAYFFSIVSPTATCKDLTISYSKHRSGTCSHHQGVLKWH